MAITPKVSISVVSHGQSGLVFLLLGDLARYCRTPIEVFLTLNTFETLDFDTHAFPFPVYVIQNSARKGFGANHNNAFKQISEGTFFCVLNPDVRLDIDPFPALMAKLQKPSVGVVAPTVYNDRGEVEDSARAFPTPLSIFLRAVGRIRHQAGHYEKFSSQPDWVGGMFMLFRTETFRALGGFDERYFLYYEDVDICWRLKNLGLLTQLESSIRIIHCARRDSHRRIRYMLWHLSSMGRFFVKRAWTNFLRSVQEWR